MQQKLKVVSEENDILRENNSVTQKRLFATATELVKQTSITLEQNNIIANLNQQMTILDDSLKTAFDNIGKLQSNVQTQRKTITDYSQSRNQSFHESLKKNDIDFMINEFFSQSVIPNKFTRISEGVYIFGSKKINLKIVNDKLVVQMNGGSLQFEEFIRLYAHQEIMKIKSGKINSYVNVEDEDIPQEAKNNQIIWDIDHEQPKPQSKKARTELSQMSSMDSMSISRSAKKEIVQTGGYIMSESSQQDSNDQDLMVFDITPQNGRDQAILQNGLKRSSRHKPTEKAVDPYIVFTNNLRNYDTEVKRTSTRSHDPFKGSSSRTSMKKY